MNILVYAGLMHVIRVRERILVNVIKVRERILGLQPISLVYSA